MMYHTDGEFRSDSGETQKAINPNGVGVSRLEPFGALSIFMRRLAAVVNDQKNGGRDTWDITLVGHSMGTIILNEMLRQFGMVSVKDMTTGQDTEVIMPFNKFIWPPPAAYETMR